MELPEEPVDVFVAPRELATAVDALLGNVLAHTPEGTPFRVTVTTLPAGGALVVEDDGPGFSSGQIPARGESATGSTGLGLDIVRRTAVRSGGELLAGPASHGGARIEVRFGRQRPRWNCTDTAGELSVPGHRRRV